MRAEKRPLRLITIALFAFLSMNLLEVCSAFIPALIRLVLVVALSFQQLVELTGKKRALILHQWCILLAFFSLYFELPSAIPGIEPWKGHLKDDSVR